MTLLPDQRYETARDHLQQALAMLPQDGSAMIRLLIAEAARRCAAKAYGDPAAPLPLRLDPEDAAPE